MNKELMILSPVTETAWIKEVTRVTADCGHECWLSPGSQEKYGQENVDTQCLDCFGGMLALKKSVLEGNATAANPEEIRQQLKRMSEQN